MLTSSLTLDQKSSTRLDQSCLADCYPLGMKTTPEIRLENLNRLIAEEGKAAAFARKIGKDPRQVSQWRGRKGSRNVSDPIAREIEAALGLKRGWMDKDHSSESGASQSATDIPADRIARLEQEVKGFTGLFSILLTRLGNLEPAEGAVVALELRRYLATPEYEGEALPALLEVVERSVPSSVPSSRPSTARSAK